VTITLIPTHDEVCSCLTCTTARMVAHDHRQDHDRRVVSAIGEFAVAVERRSGVDRRRVVCRDAAKARRR
jgi:hypothetical protein